MRTVKLSLNILLRQQVSHLLFLRARRVKVIRVKKRVEWRLMGNKTKIMKKAPKSERKVVLRMGKQPMKPQQMQIKRKKLKETLRKRKTRRDFQSGIHIRI